MRTRYVYDNKGNQVVVESRNERARNWQILPDIQPYRSMIDGSIINSRSRHREHLRAHGCEEIGNDSSLTREPKPIASPPGLKEAIIRAANETLKRK